MRSEERLKDENEAYTISKTIRLASPAVMAGREAVKKILDRINYAHSSSVKSGIDDGGNTVCPLY